MENQEPGFKDYLKIIKRRSKALYIPIVLVSLLSVLLAVLLPSVYRSSATILIEEQEIPSDLVRSTVTTFADQRIQIISQRIMTRSNLTKIIDKYDLYADERKTEPLELILEEIREMIQVQTISAEVIDPRNGRPTEATIAFTLSFDDESSVLAQKVANELTTLFLKENIKSRARSAENATLFLKEEARRLKGKVDHIQAQLAKFKEENLDQLPEMSSLNQQEITALNTRLMNLEGQERSVQERRFYLQGQLAQIDPNALATNAVGNRVYDMKDRLKVLESQYPSLLSSYSANHPDVISMKREIESLKSQLGSKTDLNKLNAELTDKKADLAVLQQKYSSTHPDIVKRQKQIDTLQKAMLDAKTADLKTSAIDPDNPAYITLMSQLEAVNNEITSLEYSRKRMTGKIEDLRKSLRKAPLVEKQYLDLLQELDSNTMRFREVTAKEMEAEISQQLELERKGERFTLIDPPQEALEPVSPNRTAILVLGLVLAVASGFAVVALNETLDATVNSEKAVTLIMGTAPLVSIPYLEDKLESDAIKRNKRLFYIGSAISMIVLTIIFHFLFMPLDVFWFRLMRIMGV